ncbi:ATP synthase subunit I [Bacillus multifaciens]|uniref:ATP synthase subunit I n=1 Tax=Bacillus multifaciens TaxID=3068506 RepID=UPI0027419FCC|nr:ATP synthase subunit I [Bacillus sp. WLY-B-L8]MDP7978942.1 ATP synthase subunit I [Bacillus sp. WLY-B-L8]HDX9591069.1 ATP synthase subunit I [Bacillus pseudomycoides]
MINMSLQTFKVQTYYILAFMMLGWAFTPFSPHFLGIGLGFLVSTYCVWILGRRIEKIGESIVKKSKSPTLGMINRFAAAILGAIIMYEIEHHMVMWAFAVGIMGGYILIVINLAYYSMKDTEK